MTLEELKGLRDTVQQIEHLGRLKQKLLNMVTLRFVCYFRYAAAPRIPLW
jgi:hypothetical protein